jgi:hypothetical protein
MNMLHKKKISKHHKHLSLEEFKKETNISHKARKLKANENFDILLRKNM